MTSGECQAAENSGQHTVSPAPASQCEPGMQSTAGPTRGLSTYVCPTSRRRVLPSTRRVRIVCALPVMGLALVGVLACASPGHAARPGVSSPHKPLYVPTQAHSTTHHSEAVTPSRHPLPASSPCPKTSATPAPRTTWQTSTPAPSLVYPTAPDSTASVSQPLTTPDGASTPTVTATPTHNVATSAATTSPRASGGSDAGAATTAAAAGSTDSPGGGLANTGVSMLERQLVLIAVLIIIGVSLVAGTTAGISRRRRGDHE